MAILDTSRIQATIDVIRAHPGLTAHAIYHRVCELGYQYHITHVYQDIRRIQKKHPVTSRPHENRTKSLIWFYDEKGPAPLPNRKITTLKLVQDNPGITTREIYERMCAMGYRFNFKEVSKDLAYIARSHPINAIPGRYNAYRWYYDMMPEHSEWPTKLLVMEIMKDRNRPTKYSEIIRLLEERYQRVEHPDTTSQACRYLVKNGFMYAAKEYIDRQTGLADHTYKLGQPPEQSEPSRPMPRGYTRSASILDDRMNEDSMATLTPEEMAAVTDAARRMLDYRMSFMSHQYEYKGKQVACDAPIRALFEAKRNDIREARLSALALWLSWQEISA
jgi:hypothetical protein